MPEKRMTSHPMKRSRRERALVQREREWLLYSTETPLSSGYEPENRDDAMVAADKDIKNLRKKLGVQ